MKNLSRVFTAGIFLLIVAFGEAWAAGPTFVQNGITQSTTWTTANSPYVIQNNVVIFPGAVLTIEPGVEVQFTVAVADKAGTGPTLFIRGGLKAVGTETSPISFVPAVAGSQWGTLYFSNSDSANSILTQCKVVGGRIKCKGSSPTISNCSISNGICGIEVSANAQPQILDNSITGNGYGLVVSADTASPVIQRNTISGNRYGVYLKDFSTPNISNNKIYGNTYYNLVNMSAKPLDMPNNDFNSADGTMIAKTVYDGANKSTLGRLNVGSFTVAANPSTPSAPAASTSAQADLLTPASNNPPPPPENAAAPANNIPAPPPAAVQTASSKGTSGGFVPQIGINLGLSEQNIFNPDGISFNGQSFVAGVGASLFIDYRPFQLISVGLGSSFGYFPGTAAWNVSSVDVGGRLFPLGSSPGGEFYLLGGLGLSLSVMTLNAGEPGHYHGFAGLGYRFAMGAGNGLEMGAQYDYYSPQNDPLNGLSLKLGWTFLIDAK